MIELVKGWYNHLNSITDDKARVKAETCIKCEHLKKNSIYEIIKNDKIKEVSGTMCGKCKCPIGAVIRSNKKCPINKF